MAETISYSAYGRLKGWRQSYVSKLVAQGKIPLAADGKIDPKKADAALAKARDPSKGATRARHAKKRNGNGSGAAPAPQDGSFLEARTMREEFSARQAKLNYELAVGKALQTEELERVWADSLMATRDEALSIADRIAARLAASADVSECWRIVDEAVRLALRHIVQTHERTEATN